MKFLKSKLNIRLMIFFLGLIIWFTIDLYFVVNSGKLSLSFDRIRELISSEVSTEYLRVLLMGTIINNIWNIIPHITYLLATIRIKSFVKIIIPGTALICGQLYNLIKLNPLNDTGAQAGLEILAWPVIELIFLGIGFLVGFITDLILIRIIKRVN